MNNYPELIDYIFSLPLTPSEQAELTNEIEHTAFPSERTAKEFIRNKAYQMIESEIPKEEYYYARKRRSK